MKKKLLVLLFIVSAIVCVFASCGECKHESYEVKSTVAATCVAEGKTISACTECGLEKVETIPKTGNHVLKYEEIEPTCKEAGKNISTCTVEGCTYVSETEGKPRLEQCNAEDAVINEVRAATCTETGLKECVCKVCGKEQWMLNFTPVIPALGHTYERGGLLTDEEKGISYVAGNCATEGYVARVCKDCGYDEDPISREEYGKSEDCDLTIYDSMQAWGHSFDRFVESVAPTCTVEGHDVYACVNEGCEETENRVTADANGHDYVKTQDAVEGTHYEITVKPTCINPGTKVYICTVCNEHATDDENIESVPVISHNITDTNDEYQVVSMEATCTEAAYKVFKCSADPLCDKTETFTYGDPLGHNWEKKAEPSCATEGNTYYECINKCNGVECTEWKWDIPTAEIKHVKGSVVAAATCVDNAVYKCAICENEYSAYDDDVDGKAHGKHEYNELAEVVSPTCISEGYNVYMCTAGECNTYYGDDENERDRDVTPRIDHDFNPVTEDGRIVCVACSQQYRDVSTEVTSNEEDLFLCLGCGNSPCTCGLKVEWNGYVSPKEPEAITANVKFTKTEVIWTEVEQDDTALAIGEGIIILYGEENTTYTVEIYDAVNGKLLETVTKTGEAVMVDLFKYATVGQVSITATTDATVSFYAPVK